MAIQNLKKTYDKRYLTARGKSGILTKFKLKATSSKNKKLKRTAEDSERVKTLIKEYDAIKNHIKSQGLLNRLSLERIHLRFLYKQIKLAVINQGFVSSNTLARFYFNPAELIEKITYRNLIEEFATDNIAEWQNDVIQLAIVEEAKKGQGIDINKLSDEFYELDGELKRLEGSGELTQAEIDAGWLAWTELKNRDKTEIYSKLAKIENLCFYVTYNPQNPDLKILDTKRLLSLPTSNLERIISFYCKKMNKHNSKLIAAKRKSAKRLQTNKKYIHKKVRTAKQTRDLVKDLKAEGKTQKEVAKKIGCSERTVRTYWK
jgi:hypothetical protein